MTFSQSPAPIVGHASVNALLWRSDSILSLLGYLAVGEKASVFIFPVSHGFLRYCSLSCGV